MSRPFQCHTRPLYAPISGPDVRATWDLAFFRYRAHLLGFFNIGISILPPDRLSRLPPRYREPISGPSLRYRESMREIANRYRSVLDLSPSTRGCVPALLLRTRSAGSAMKTLEIDLSGQCSLQYPWRHRCSAISRINIAGDVGAPSIAISRVDIYLPPRYRE